VGRPDSSGADVSAGLVAVNPTTLDFSTIDVGAVSAAQAVTVTVSGTAVAINAAVSGIGFAISADTCAALQPVGTCTISVQFAPAAQGLASGSLTVNGAAVSLSGRGVAGTGGSTGAGGKAGAGGSTGSGGSVSTGGIVGSGGTGAKPSGGSGGSTVIGTAATCTTDLMTLRTGTDNNWIPSTPPSCGIQGSLSAYSDGSTCTSPSPITASACASGTAGCCISGTTVIDSTSAKWGCGLVLDLNSSAGTSATKSAYAGAAKGFKITITGTVATGQVIRIMYGSAATDPTGGTAPYKEVAGLGTYSVLFSDATCPAWATGTKCAVVSGNAAYSLKVQIPGGSAATDKVGAFSNVCITSITPI